MMETIQEILWIINDYLTPIVDFLERNYILFTALIGIIPLYLLYRRAKAADQNAKAAIENTKIAHQGLAAERLTRAMEQLASENSSIRLGGILGLEQIAETQKGERTKIIQILSARIRELAPKGKYKEEESEELVNRQDIRTAISIMARIMSKTEDLEEIETCNLGRIDLRYIELRDMNLFGFSLFETDFRHACLDRSTFGGSLIGSDFSYAYLEEANLSGLFLHGANLTDASLEGANLSSAILSRAILTETSLEDANLSSTDFYNVKGLTQEQLDEAFCWRGAPPINLPDGLKPPPAIERPKEDSKAPGKKWWWWWRLIRWARS